LAYAITQYADKFSRKAWPFQSTLAADLGVTDRTVRNGIANLVKRGHLSVTPRGRDQSAIYKMIIQDRKSTSGLNEEKPETDFRSSTEDRKSGAARPEKKRTKTGSAFPTEPLFEPLREPLKEESPPREGESRSSGRRSQPKIRWPEGFELTAEMITYAAEKAGWDRRRTELQFERFENHSRQHGRIYSDWKRAWFNWVLKGVEFAQRDGPPQGPVIDQNGNHVPTPPNQQRSPPSYRESTTERLMRKMGDGNG
jgi:Helix-turn-helix domain